MLKTGCPLRLNHQEPSFGTVAQDAATVSSSNSWYRGPDDGVHGFELWKSDGTEAGSVMVKDINPGFMSSSPNYFTVVNGTLFFAANDGIHGYELWALTLTGAGTDNQLPVANAGADQSVHPGISVTLNSSGSYDPDNNYLRTFTT